MEGHQRDTAQTLDPTTSFLPRTTRLIKHNDALRPPRNSADSLPWLVIQKQKKGKQFRQHKHCPSTTISISSPLLPNFPKNGFQKPPKLEFCWSLIAAEGERPYYFSLAPADLPLKTSISPVFFNPASSTSFFLLVPVIISHSFHLHQWGAAAPHKTRRHLPASPLPCIPCSSPFPLVLIKRKSAATNQDPRPYYPDQDIHVHTNSWCLKSLSVDLLFGHICNPSLFEKAESLNLV